MDAKETENFGLKYGNQAEWISNMAKNLEVVKKVRKRKYSPIYTEQH